MTLPPHSTPPPPAGRKLRPAHARAVLVTLRPMFGFLGRLRDRMYAVGFVEKDPLMQIVVTTHDSLHRLTVELHYQGCEQDGARAAAWGVRQACGPKRRLRPEAPQAGHEAQQSPDRVGGI